MSFYALPAIQNRCCHSEVLESNVASKGWTKLEVAGLVLDIFIIATASVAAALAICVHFGVSLGPLNALSGAAIPLMAALPPVVVALFIADLVKIVRKVCVDTREEPTVEISEDEIKDQKLNEEKEELKQIEKKQERVKIQEEKAAAIIKRAWKAHASKLKIARQKKQEIEEQQRIEQQRIKKIQEEKAAVTIQRAWKVYTSKLHILKEEKLKQQSEPLKDPYPKDFLFKNITEHRLELEDRVPYQEAEILASTNFYDRDYYRDDREIPIHICEFKKKLYVLQLSHDKNYMPVYTSLDYQIEDVLLEMSKQPKYGYGTSIQKVLQHKEFNSKQFLEDSLKLDESGTPRLFGFSKDSFFDLLEIESKFRMIDPLKMIDPVSKRNILVQAAHWGEIPILHKMSELYPEAFQSVGQEIIAEFLKAGHMLFSKHDSLLEPFEKLGEKLDLFHSMWFQVAKGCNPDENFSKQFKLLTVEQQRVLYDAAYSYNNPFIHEPPDLPVRADQYSINLMWINKNKMSTDQEFLFGNGNSAEERQLDFHTRFVVPVAEWAKANPGSPIDIWVDGEMATPEAIERSRQILQKALERSIHGTIYFRDVRSIDSVRQNAHVFNEDMHIYFRVDLLRAIAADHVLRNKEVKYFVYGDIDMKPLSGQQLFDKRTVNYLDDFGIVMAKGGFLGFENGFQILNGDNRRCMDSHRKVIINLSIEMATESPKSIGEQQIYDTYPAMITRYLAYDGRYGKRTIASRRQSFRYDMFRTSAHTLLPLGDGNTRLKDIMPRKPVELPPSRFG